MMSNKPIYKYLFLSYLKYKKPKMNFFTFKIKKIN